jgi:hypothetical protein
MFYDQLRDVSYKSNQLTIAKNKIKQKSNTQNQQKGERR